MYATFRIFWVLGFLFCSYWLSGRQQAVILSAAHEYELHSLSEATEKIAVQVLISSQESSHNELYINYDSFSKVKDLEATVYDANGKKIRRLKQSDAEDLAKVDGVSLYSDSRYKKLSFLSSQYPITVEYSYHKVYSAVRVFPVWQPCDYLTKVISSTFEIHVPEGYAFQYRDYQIDQPVVKTIEDGMDRYQWSLFDYSPPSREAFTPPNYIDLPLVLAVPSRFQIGEAPGDLSSWTKFGSFIYELNKAQHHLTPTMRATVEKLTAGLTTDREKIAILYTYLQEQTRYVSVQWGIGGWQAYNAEYVEANQYGDCKALSHFMKGMLEAVEIESKTVLINSGDQWWIQDSAFANPYFNHMILYVPSEDMWLECTSSKDPVGWIGEHIADRPALVLDATDSQLRQTPPTVRFEEDQHTRIELLGDGNATATMTGTGTGYSYAWASSVVHYSDASEREKRIKNDLDFDEVILSEGDLTVNNAEQTSHWEYQLELNRYATLSGNRLFVPLNQVNALAMQFPKVKERRAPVHIDRAAVYRDTVQLLLPEGFQLENSPEDVVSVSSPYGEYAHQIQTQENMILFYRTLTLDALVVPSEEYDELRSFFETVRKYDHSKLILVKK